jgi:hypothetical protein
MLLAAMLDFMPLLALIGATALVSAALVVGFWPWIEGPFISWLHRQRDERALRRRRRDLQRATKERARR